MHVVEAELELAPDADPRAPGGAITVELCGHWDHEGECRWPHHTTIDAERSPARLRTEFTAGAAEEAQIRERIEKALRAGPDWRVVSVA